jgi:hypothetical protein
MVCYKTLDVLFTVHVYKSYFVYFKTLIQLHILDSFEK